jgi:hypothetical protein
MRSNEWMRSNEISKSKIEANPRSLRVPIYVIRSGKAGLTITCADSKYGFKIRNLARATSEILSEAGRAFC